MKIRYYKIYYKKTFIGWADNMTIIKEWSKLHKVKVKIKKTRSVANLPEDMELYYLSNYNQEIPIFDYEVSKLQHKCRVLVNDIGEDIMLFYWYINHLHWDEDDFEAVTSVFNPLLMELNEYSNSELYGYDCLDLFDLEELVTKALPYKIRRRKK